MLKESELLITGGTGRLGKACKKIIPAAQYPGRDLIDVRDAGKIARYFEKNTVKSVVHLAAVAGIVQCENNQAESYDINVNGVKRLLEAAKNAGVEHFVLLSTACVFPGVVGSGAMPDEDTVPYPKHFYGMTKWLAEEIALTYRHSGMLVTVARTNFTTMPWEYPKAFTDRFGTYLFGQGVSQGLKDILVERPKRPIIHICGKRRLSMYEYAKLGGSEVQPMTLADYKGPPLTVDMSITSKYWHLYDIEAHSHIDN